MGIQTTRSRLAGGGGSVGEASSGVNRPFEAQHEPCRCRYPGLGVAKIARRDKRRRPLHRSGEARYLRHFGEQGDRPQLKLMHKEFVFLLNQCLPVREASRGQEGIAALETVGSLLRPHIAARADFLEAARTGKGVTDVDPKGRRGPGNARPLDGSQPPAPANSSLRMSKARHPPINDLAAARDG